MNFTLPYITGTIEYLEKNLHFFKRELKLVAKKNNHKSTQLYGSLPKVKLSFKQFKEIRTLLSSSWEKEWS